MASKKEITGKPTVIKEVNRGLLKDALSRMGQATRVELSKYTGISQPTVNVLIREMTESGEVLCLGNLDSTGGRRAEAYALNQKRHHILSVIVRSEGLEYCVFDLQLQREAHGRISREKERSVTEQLVKLISELMGKTPDVKAVSVGVPGAVSKDGVVFAIPQIPEWEQFALQSYLEETCGLQVKVMNDINAIAVGYLASEGLICDTTRESRNAEQVRNLVYLHLEGTGLGAGIIIDGKLYPGCNSFAGEAGYMQIGEDSIETQLAGAGEEKQAKILTRVLVNIICVLNPQKLVLGGTVTASLVREIQRRCMACLPEGVVTELVMLPDSGTQYIMGLGQVGLNLLDHQVRLK